MLFSVFYVGDSCQGWGREFESRFPLNAFTTMRCCKIHFCNTSFLCSLRNKTQGTDVVIKGSVLKREQS